MRVLLSVVEVLAVLAVAFGVFLVLGLGWALIVAGVLAVVAVERQPSQPRKPVVRR